MEAFRRELERLAPPGMVWRREDYTALNGLLTSVEEEGYRTFSSKLIPDIRRPIRGIRAPYLRQTAKQVAKTDFPSFFQAAGEDSHEELMLQALVTGAVKTGWEEHVRLMEAFVPKIDNWAVCDSFCAAQKFVSRHREESFAFLKLYLSSPDEFSVRFAVVMLLDHFITDDHGREVLTLLAEVSHPGYYVKMAVAWALSSCYLKLEQETTALFKGQKLDAVTRRMALQKIRDSRQVTEEKKRELHAILSGMSS